MADFRVLILVLASDNSPLYCKLQSLWRKLQHPRADILFLKAHPNIQGDDFIHETTIFISCEETLEKVYEKQMRGFRLLVPQLDKYAFVFRTNLSSHVDIQKYLDYCETLPRNGVYRGVVDVYEGKPFASGSGYTITPDLIKRIVQEDPPEIFLDDVSVGHAIQQLGINVIPAPRIDYTQLGWLCHGCGDEPVFHRRVRSDDRDADLRVLTLLFEKSQPIVVDKPLPKNPLWMFGKEFLDRRQ
jgi:hypothetical protein